MSWSVWFVTLARAIVFLAYGITIILLAYYSVLRSTSTETAKSSAHLQPNHRHDSTDLQIPTADDLVGHYLRVEVNAGQAITPSIVSKRPMVPVIPTGIILVVNIEKAQAKLRELE